MKVILLQEVEKLGYKDDVVNVKDGYAQNFLIPQKKAILANSSNVKALEDKLKQQESGKQKLLEGYRQQVSKIEAAVIRIGVKAGTTGKIFGSVNPHQIADSIRNQTGIEVDRKKIKISEEVKNVGNYRAEVELYKDVKANLNILVEAE